MNPNSLFGNLTSPDVGKTPTHLSRLLILLSILLALFLLYLALRNMDWQNFYNTVRNAQYVYLPFVFIWGSISYLIRALRLRILLTTERHLPINNVFWANMAGYLGNNILPARAGELVRAGYLARQNNISSSFALAVGLLERLMDLIALIVLGSFALSSTGVVLSVFQNALKAVSVLGLVGLVAVFVLPSFGHLAGRFIIDFPMLKEAHKIKLNSFLQQFIVGLKSLHSFTRIVQFVSITGLIWLIDAIGIMLLAYILKISLLLQQAFVLLAALGLSSAIPSTPGYVGVYQYVAVITLAPFGVSQADALAYILVSQVINFLIIGFWGLISLWRFNKLSTQEA